MHKKGRGVYIILEMSKKVLSEEEKLLRDLKTKIKTRLYHQNRFYHFDDKQVLYPITLISSVLSKSKIRMGSFFASVVDNAYVYYLDGKDKKCKKCRLKDFSGLKISDDGQVEGLFTDNNQWVIWYNPPMYVGALKELADKYEIPYKVENEPMNAKSLSKISIDHIYPASKVLVANSKNHAVQALKVLDKIIRDHEEHEECQLKGYANYLDDMAVFKKFCTLLRDYALSDKAKECQCCNGQNLSKICKKILEEFNKELEEKEEPSRLFSIQLMDYSENCRRGDYSRIENQLLHQITDKLEKQTKTK